MNPCAYLLFKNRRSCDHRNIMILYQGFPNWGVPLVICKPLKSGTRAALCQEQGGGRSWSSADLEETGKGCLGSEWCSKCQMLPLWLFLALHQGAAAAFLEEGGLKEVYGEGGEQRGSSAHTHTHTVHSHSALTQGPFLSPRLSGAQSSLPWTPELQDSPVPRVSITSSLSCCCSAAQGLPEHSGTLLSCTDSLAASPKQIQVWEALYYSHTEKAVRSTTRWMRRTNPCDLTMRWHICYFFWLCIKTFLCLHAWYTYLFWQTPSAL